MSIPKENKIIANAALEAFGGKPKVIKHWDEKEKSSIDILSVVDKPSKGIISYSTIGLYAYPLKELSGGGSLSVEFVGACYDEYDNFSNIMATCAFNIINSNFTCSPGEVFKDVVKMYYKKNTMKHVYFATPFLWDDKLDTIDFDKYKTTWLLVIPISDKEMKFLDKNGSDALEDLFEEKQINIFDLSRESVV